MTDTTVPSNERANRTSNPMTTDIISALRGGALRSVRPVLQDLSELAAQEIERLIRERDEALAHEGEKDSRIEELLTYLKFDGTAHRDWVADCQTLESERDNWMQSAAEFARNMEYYRDLVDRIGRVIGPEAFTADDGSKSEDVLRAKVPEIIERMLGTETATRSCHCGRFPFAEGIAYTVDDHAQDHWFDGTPCECEDPEKRIPEAGVRDE